MCLKWVGGSKTTARPFSQQKLRKFNLLTQFYLAAVRSSVTVWFGSATKTTVAEKCKTNHDSENKITNYKCKFKKQNNNWENTTITVGSSQDEILIRQDLLSQLQGKIWHPQPEIWKLWVWPILWRKSPQLLVCFVASRRGLATSKHRIYHWVRGAILLTDEVCGLPSPLSVRAHSTRSMSSSHKMRCENIEGGFRAISQWISVILYGFQTIGTPRGVPKVCKLYAASRSLFREQGLRE